MKLARLRPLALPAFFSLAFLLFFLLTFPFDAVARRIEGEARKSGTELTIGSLGAHGFFGFRARDVKVHLGGEPGSDATFARVDLHPDYLSLLIKRVGFSFALQGYGGLAHGHARLSNDAQPGLLALTLDAEDVDLHGLPLVPPEQELAGKLSLKLDLPALSPLEAASGTASMTLKGASLVKGVAKLEGGMTMPIPRLALGDVDGAVTIDKGSAKIDRLTARGGDLDADVDGNVHLRPAAMLSQADLHAKLRPNDKWLDANPALRGMMSFLGPRAPDGSYTVSATGPLSRLVPRPGR